MIYKVLYLSLLFQVGKFQQAVRRHLGKDRLFHLVTTLLKSIEEERKAQNDLILSFETARNIKIDIPSHDRKINESRQKRRRKKLEVSLADRIDAKRNNKAHDSNAEGHNNVRQNTFTPEAEKLVKESNNEEIVGQLEVKATNIETTSDSISGELKSPLGSNENHSALKNSNELTLTTSIESDNSDGRTVDSNPDVDQKYTITGQKHRSIHRNAFTEEKANVVEHFRNTDENFDLDKLVLESVLESTCMGANREDENNNDKTKDQREDKDDNEKRTDRSIYKFQHVVEVDSDDSYIELQNNIKGKTDDLENCFELWNKEGENDFFSKEAGDKQFERFLTEHQHVTSSQSRRMQSNLMKPNLKTSSEMKYSAALFSSPQENSSDNIIEIVTNKAILHKLNRAEATHANKFDTKQTRNRTKVKKSGYKSMEYSVSEKNTAEEAPYLGNPSNSENSESVKSPQRLVFIDLLGVYESNKDFQKINLGNPIRSKKFFEKPKTKPAIPTGTKISSSRIKRPNCISYCLPISNSPKALPKYPRTFRTSNNYSFLSSPSCVRNALSSNEYLEYFRDYAVKKGFQRYKKPDNVLWSQLNILDNSKTSKLNCVLDQSYNYKYAQVADQKQSDALHTLPRNLYHDSSQT